MAKVLWLTGFGPFPGVDDNPTAEVARRLHGQRVAGFEVLGEVLQTSFEASGARVKEALPKLRPAAALHLGVAKNEKELRVEAVAANEQTASIPDEDGVLALGQRCSLHFPVAQRLLSAVHVDELTHRLRRHGLPARRSEDAGRYVCNSTYFLSLEAAKRLDPAPLVLFLHVPPVGKPKTIGGATWQLEDLVLAARVALIGLTDALTGRSTGPIA